MANAMTYELSDGIGGIGGFVARIRKSIADYRLYQQTLDQAEAAAEYAAAATLAREMTEYAQAQGQSAVADHALDDDHRPRLAGTEAQQLVDAVDAALQQIDQPGE